MKAALCEELRSIITLANLNTLAKLNAVSPGSLNNRSQDTCASPLSSPLRVAAYATDSVRSSTIFDTLRVPTMVDRDSD
jgi:hypothetical protein